MADDPAMQFFVYDQLPATLKDIAKPFCDLAHKIVGTDVVPGLLPANQARTVALHKLSEAKDAALESALGIVTW